MKPLILAQFMSAAVFFTIALVHLLIWSRRFRLRTHLLFAITAIAAGGNAIAESLVYGAATIESMAVGLKW